MINNITSRIELEEHCGTMQPKEPWEFAKAIQRSQSGLLPLDSPTFTFLFNKGRYFESSFYNQELLNEVSDLTGLKIEYNNMICGNWKYLETFVFALNVCGFYAFINIDWI